MQVFTSVQAKIEAVRCLMCADAPCACDCPAGISPREFIRKIRFDNMAGAVRALKKANVLAASCSYICPTGNLCTKGCTIKGLSHPIDIAGLQKYVMDWEKKVGMIEPVHPPKDGKKVAVIGSGPAGLGCAAELAIRGHSVTVFEKDEKLGGMLSNCIPSFRLPDDIVDFEIEFIKKLGIEFVLGKNVTEPKEFLSQGFDAVFVGTGLNRSKVENINGIELIGVYQALEFLKQTRCGDMPELGGRVVIIGGGDTALDAARTAKLKGKEVFVLYRRTQKEMPAYPDEIKAAWDDGVEFYFRTIVRAISGDENVKAVKCVRIKWHAKTKGMPQSYEVEGTEFSIPCDSVIMAIGQEPTSDMGLRTTPNGFLAIEKDTMMTSHTGIFAGGDVATGGSTAARAVGQGKLAAIKIDEFIRHEIRDTRHET